GATAALVVSGALSQTWMPGGLTSSFITVNPQITTIYTVTGTQANGCVSSNTFTQYVNPLPCLTISTSSSSVLIVNSATISVSGLISYTWNTGSTQQFIVVTPTVNTDYTVRGFNAEGYYGMASITESVIDIT